MNINDVKDTIKIPETKELIWKKIFKKQWKLALKYKEIENMGNLLDTRYENINTAKGQKWIKDFAWRVTEELAEAMEANEMNHKEHFKEELSDALHFLVELTLIANYDEKIILKEEKEPKKSNVWDIVYYLGLMCNTLKNKPWKQTQILTDRNEFKKYLTKTWKNLINFLHKNMGTTEDIYIYYFKKNKVNQFRQRSKY